jgi:hypothetical protein
MTVSAAKTRTRLTSRKAACAAAEPDKAEFLKCLRFYPELEKRLSAFEFNLMLIDYRLAKAQCFAEPMDYLKYRFFELEREEWSEYITRRQYSELCERYNCRADEAIVKDKAKFAAKYKEYTRRKIIEAREENAAAFAELCSQCDRVAIKPARGSYGRGICMADSGCARKLWNAAVSGNCVIEAAIEQHAAMAQIHPQSVNTVRTIVAISGAGESKMIAAVFRCGRGDAVTDNNGGIFAPIDLPRGEICGCGATHFGERFCSHPDTGVRFNGIKIPCWSELVSDTEKASQVSPGLRIMNWDWALRADGRWALIEGNVGGGFGPCQEAVGRGMKRDLIAALGEGPEENQVRQGK